MPSRKHRRLHKLETIYEDQELISSRKRLKALRKKNDGVWNHVECQNGRPIDTMNIIESPSEPIETVHNNEYCFSLIWIAWEAILNKIWSQ
jgi:hypothetical protein